MIIGAGSIGNVYEVAQATPQMHETIQGWFQPMTVGIVTVQNVDRQAVESITTIETKGVIQPLSARAVEQKPEGQRDWKWSMLHCAKNLLLKNNDVIRIHGVQFRVMKNWQYQDYGYLQYDICEDFQPPNLA